MWCIPAGAPDVAAAREAVRKQRDRLPPTAGRQVEIEIELAEELGLGQLRLGALEPEIEGLDDAGADGAPALFSVDITGRNLRRVPTPGPASDPAWSPLLD
mgnify:CR=1 FL=1